MTSKISDMTAQVLRLESDDEVALKYLGAAVVLQWHGFPDDVRQSLIQQAVSVGGLPPLEHLQDQIKALIARVRG
jgi:hypothetical protein